MLIGLVGPSGSAGRAAWEQRDRALKAVSSTKPRCSDGLSNRRSLSRTLARWLREEHCCILSCTGLRERERPPLPRPSGGPGEDARGCWLEPLEAGSGLHVGGTACGQQGGVPPPLCESLGGNMQVWTLRHAAHRLHHVQAYSTFCKEVLGHCATGLEREAPNAARPSPPRPLHGEMTPSEEALEGLLRCIAHLLASLRGALSSLSQQHRHLALCDLRMPIVARFRAVVTV